MQHATYEDYDEAPLLWRLRNSIEKPRISRHVVIATILVVALLAFEIFNFDTTRYALSSLIGETSFVGVTWASVLAIAFCSIDFAGLSRIFTRQPGVAEPKETWYLVGAWVLGAMMNAIMTWWAISLVLLSHNQFGNEVMDRETLLKVVPIFVAVLVFLTRILFIGSLTVTGEKLMNQHRKQAQRVGRQRPTRAAHYSQQDEQQALQIRERRRSQMHTQPQAQAQKPLTVKRPKAATTKKPAAKKPATAQKRTTNRPRSGLGTVNREPRG